MRIRNPRTGELDYTIAPLDAKAVAAEAARLRRAQPAWAAMSAEQRGDVLQQWAAAIEAHATPLTEALAADSGRYAISAMEVTGVSRQLRRWATTAPALIAEAAPSAQPTAHATITTDTHLVPYPLVGVISPWNFPLTLALIDAIPALAAGCAVLIKPSEVTPRFIRPLRESLQAVPQLAAVLSIIEGDGQTGAEMIEQADYICFTGSVSTGRKVAEAAARAFVPTSLELGGKDAMIILPSAVPAQAAAIALRASIVNAGQACQSIERVYVAAAIAEAFLASLVEQAEAVRYSYPDPRRGEIAPFIFAEQATIAQAHIDDAVAKGARVLCGGRVETLGGGLYLRPTVLAEVTADMVIMKEETFAPTIPVAIFADVEEAIALANDSTFGLSAAVVGGDSPEDVAQAKAVAARLQVGAVSINDGALTSMVWEAEKSAFGASGMGASRMGTSGLLRFLRKRVLIHQQGAAAQISNFSEENYHG